MLCYMHDTHERGAAVTMLRLGFGCFEVTRPSLVSKTAHRYAERSKGRTWDVVVERVGASGLRAKMCRLRSNPLIRLGYY
jgi:hypothetical protein